MDHATEQTQAREGYALYIVRCEYCDGGERTSDRVLIAFVGEGVPRILTWRGSARPVYAKVKAGGGKSQKRYLDNDTAVVAPLTV